MFPAKIQIFTHIQNSCALEVESLKYPPPSGAISDKYYSVVADLVAHVANLVGFGL